MTSSSASVAAELERMVVLRDQGILTPEEFSAQKARLLGSSQAQAVGAASARTAISDVWVYASMAVPLVVAVLFASGFGIGEFHSGYVYLIANLTFLLLDYRQVRAAGHPIHMRLLMGGVAFLPLYLFVRAVELRRGYKYVGLYLFPLAVLVIVILALSGNGNLSVTR